MAANSPNTACEFPKPNHRGKRQRMRGRRVTALVAATLAGGTLFGGTCEARIRDSVVNGTQLFVLNLLNPSNITITGE